MKKQLLILSLCLVGCSLVAQENLGVNQSNPTAKTHITNTQNQNSFRVDDEAGDATPFVIDSLGNAGVKTSTPSVSLDVNGTDAIGIPAGTTAERPVIASSGDMRFNTAINGIEYFNGTVWVSISPAGTIQMFGGVTASVPNGWLVCDGSEISRTTYASLYVIIGDAFGEGDGATTFNLPDLRGRFVRGVDNGASNDPDAPARTISNLGGNSGDNVGSLQDDEFSSHNHGGGVHNHANNVSGSLTTGAGTTNNKWTRGNSSNSSGSLSWNTELCSPIINNEGGSETRPKNVNVNFIIKF
jgi:microcystin-dependent protein